MTQSAIAAWVGIDWADKEHAVCLSTDTDGQLQSRLLPHTPEAIGEFVAELRTRFGGRPVAIALEQSRGPLIYALMAHDFLRLYPIHPATANSYRKTFKPSGTKTDHADALMLCDLLRRHHDKLTVWQPNDPLTRQLSLLCEHRRRLVHSQTAHVQQVRAALKNYFPQALQWCGTDLASPMAVAFLQKWPTLAALQRAKPATLKKFYYRHNLRRPQLLEQRLEQIAQATALTQDTALIEAYSLQVKALCGQLLPLLRSIAAYDRKIQELFAAHPDAELFRSFPGAGAQLAPRLAVLFGTDRSRFANARQVQCLSGVAPVTRSSGRLHLVQRRYACAKFLLQTMHEFSRCSLLFCDWAQAFYQSQRARGKAHHAAIRALAFKWVRILWRCWQDRQSYDPQRYTETLKRHGSALANPVPTT